MNFNSDFEFTFGDDIEIPDHIAAFLHSKYAVVDELVVNRAIGLLYLSSGICANQLLLKNDLVADVIYSLEHASHLLNVVL